MKNLLFLSLTVFTLSLFSLQSCKKGNNPLKPYETTDHPEIWNFDFGLSNPGSKTIPAMDANGNIYFAIQNNDTDPVSLFAIDKTGQKLWKKEFAGKLTSQIIYQGGNIYFAAEKEDSHTVTRCLSASSGEMVWENNTRQIGGCVMSVSDNYVVTGATSGGYVTGEEDSYELQIMDKSGQVLTAIQIGNGVGAISIVGNTLYYITHHVSGTGYAKIELTKYNLTLGNAEWVHVTGNDEENWRVASPDLVVDNSDKVYYVSQFGLDIYLHIINSDGFVFKEIKLNEANGVLLTPSLDTDGNIYIGAPGFIQKYSPEGDLLWTLDDYNHTTASINISYAPPLTTGGLIYYGGDGLFAAKTTPEMAWINYPETGFASPGYPVLNSDGDIIVVGDRYVNCIRGDGQHLQNSIWPKIYQNYGNTASR